MLWERRAAAGAAPVLRAAERDLSALPVVWTVCFRFCSQTKLKGFPHGFGLRKELLEWQLQLWCMVCSKQLRGRSCAVNTCLDGP